jgi:hypothetical protein
MIIRHLLSHDLDPTQSKGVIDAAFGFYRTRYPRAEISLLWQSDQSATLCFKARAITLKGTIVLRPGGIELALDLPFIFRVFQKRALRLIDNEANQWVQRAREGKLT